MSNCLARATALTIGLVTLLLTSPLVHSQSAGSPAEILGENVLLTCSQPVLTGIDCDFRLIKPGTVVDVRASIGELELPVPDLFPYPLPGSRSIVLFLIDTSDPRRAPAVAAAVKHIRQILSAARDHHLFGLATFDANMQVVVAPGASAQTILDALPTLRAQGRTTELYRNTLAAVNLAGDFPVERRSVVIFSDGQAEDRAYFHSDVVAAARRRGVSIDGLGYPRSVALSVALQTLRRMAEETGGRFVEGTTRFELPQSYLATPFAAFDSGGTLAIDLQGAIDAGVTGSGTVRVELQLGSGQAGANVQVNLPLPPPPPQPTPEPPVSVQPEPAIVAPVEPPAALVEEPPAPEPVVAKVKEAPTRSSDKKQTTGTSASGSTKTSTTVDQPTKTPTPVAPLKPAKPVSTPTRPQAAIAVPGLGVSVNLSDLLTYIAVLVGVVMIILVFVLVRVLRRRQKGATTDSPGTSNSIIENASAQVFAYLDTTDGTGDRHPITSAAYIIGRHADNELPLADPSMSRHHAQIQLKRDGTFQITDLESMNGVFVNEKRVTSATIKEGDTVEFGDVRMKFNVARQDELGGDETVMVKTSMPAKSQARGGA
jgi:outer membrane biosynthesis protein TonB